MSAADGGASATGCAVSCGSSGRPSELHEIEAITERYGTTVEDLLAGRAPTFEAPDRPAWEDQWDEIVLDLSSDE